MSLLRAIEICLNATNVPPSRFGRDSVCDPRLVHDLRLGRQPGPKMKRRVFAHISALVAGLPEGQQQQVLSRLRATAGFVCK